jgi:hypothetical protein
MIVVGKSGPTMRKVVPAGHQPVADPAPHVPCADDGDVHAHPPCRPYPRRVYPTRDAERLLPYPRTLRTSPRRRTPRAIWPLWHLSERRVMAAALTRAGAPSWAPSNTRRPIAPSSHRGPEDPPRFKFDGACLPAAEYPAPARHLTLRPAGGARPPPAPRGPRPGSCPCSSRGPRPSSGPGPRGLLR